MVVHNVHSIIGSLNEKWVLGLITQREDGNFYLEDSTLSAKLAFSELRKTDINAYFMENCIVLCYGIY